jgi:ectonucleotide pyrophosphatase/phosphodiesterase family member 5
MISWFTDPLQPINLGMLYIEDPDSTSHPFGTTTRVTEVVKRLDILTKYIQDKLLENRLDINVIHLSDHGMADVTPPNFINLTQFVDADSVKFYGTSPVLQVVPNLENSTNKVYEQLLVAAKTNGNFKIYNQKTLPERWNFQNDRRTGPITAVAELGYAFQDMWDSAKYFEKTYNVSSKWLKLRSQHVIRFNNVLFSVTSTHNYGIHGYDNDLSIMHPFFMAKGPLIKVHHKVKPFDTVDLLDLFAEILDIKVTVKTSGHRENILDILNDKSNETGHMSRWVIMRK